MRTFLKYLLPIFALILFTLMYFRYTQSGQKNAYSLLSFYISHKASLDIKIKEININQFPYIRAKLLIEEVYHVDIDGFLKHKHLDLRYTLHSSCYKSNVCTFDDSIHIKGKAQVWNNDLNVTGEGEAIGGNISYKFRKQKNRFSDIKLRFKDINTSKLSTLLEQKTFVRGISNGDINFDYIEKEKKRGSINYSIKDKYFYDMNTSIHAQIQIKDMHHTFTLDAILDDITLRLTQGTYNEKTEKAEAHYTVDINDLTQIEKYLGSKYVGALHIKGQVSYDKILTIQGLSKDFGGELHLLYSDNILNVELNNISFEALTKTLNLKSILKADTSGHMIFDLVKKEMQSNVKLKKATLIPSNITHHIKHKLALDLSQEIFDKSSLDISYKNNHISSHFTLANEKMHFILKDSKFNSANSGIDTSIDIRTPKHSLKGKLYAKVDTLGRDGIKNVYLKFNGLVEKYYTLKLQGILNEDFSNMDYSISATRLPGPLATIVDDINITGHVSGLLERLHIIGNGTAMEGNINFSALKTKDKLENIIVELKKIHTLKLFTLLGKPKLPSGKADIKATFSIFSEKKKEGTFTYILHDGLYKGVPLTLQTNASIKDTKILFDTHALLATTEINITQGKYNLDSNLSKAFYTIKTKDLSPLKEIIGEYKGPFSASGEIHYNKDFQIRGLSKSFGGIVDFLYKKEMLYIDLNKISLKRFMGLLPYPHMLDAQVQGNINYDYTKEKLLVNADLNNTRFLNSDLVQTVFQKSGVNMLKEVFPQSKLSATYQNKILLANVTLKNKQSHFYLTNTKMDANTNTVNAYFDLKMQGQEFSGKVYGSLDNPKVNLNMQKLIRYQMDKQLDSYMGKKNRKIMEAMPMGDVAKDVAAGVGGGFLDMFF